MRKVVLASLAASGLAMVGAAPAEAVGFRYPFCLQGEDSPGPEQLHLHQLRAVSGHCFGALSLLH